MYPFLLAAGVAIRVPSDRYLVGSSRPGLSEPHDGGTHPQEHRQRRQHVSDAHPASAQDRLWVHGRMPGNSDERSECHRSDEGKCQCCCTTRPPPTRENAESTSGDDQDCDRDQRTRVGEATRISGAPLRVAVDDAAARSIRASAEGLGRDDDGRGETRQRKYAVGPERRTAASEGRHRRRLPGTSRSAQRIGGRSARRLASTAFASSLPRIGTSARPHRRSGPRTCSSEACPASQNLGMLLGAEIDVSDTAVTEDEAYHVLVEHLDARDGHDVVPGTSSTAARVRSSLSGQRCA